MYIVYLSINMRYKMITTIRLISLPITLHSYLCVFSEYLEFTALANFREITLYY